MREQLTTCYGCGEILDGPPASAGRRRWCENGCQDIAADIKFAEGVGARYGLPPNTLLKDVATAIREQLRRGGRARDRAALIAAERERAEREAEDRPLRRNYFDLLDELTPLVPIPIRPRGQRDLDRIERELFGDITSRKSQRWEHLHDFAHTTRKDDGASPTDLLSDARAYLTARLAEEGFTQESEPTNWPTMGETRPRSQERT